MKKLIIGILAHVDSGKTTLSESLLYTSGKIRTLGRVDNKDAYLDTYDLEKKRGITIFSKQAIFMASPDVEITLLDTPGHVDFSAEMERTLKILDYAILVISGADGIKGHTLTLWKLLEHYEIPTFIFVNKMDQPGAEKEKLYKEIHDKLSGQIVLFEEGIDPESNESIAMCSEDLMDVYIETGKMPLFTINMAIQKRSLFPLYFGSALKLEGIKDFIEGLVHHTNEKNYAESFGAVVYKITRDDKGNRLTHIKMIGGSLKVRDLVSNGDWEEKITQIRLYSGAKYEVVSQVSAGTVCAVLGLNYSKCGEIYGVGTKSLSPLITSVLSYKILLPEGIDAQVIFPKLKQLEEEEPEYKFQWHGGQKEILVQIMGDIQLEILKSLVEERFAIAIDFDEGEIVYKETISAPVVGVGHFEPLRHYAEVQLLIEPLPRGAGIRYESKCSEDDFSKNWQRLVMTHLKEQVHKGVLTGSEVTDLCFTLVGGRAHNRHTEGGDFREATFRALRQGLKEAKSILLEPYYKFQIDLPEEFVGKAMTDIDTLFGQFEVTQSENGRSLISGKAPVATMRNYQKEVQAYTRGEGRLYTEFLGYLECHNTDFVIEKMAYDSERDTEHPTGSVFCLKGAGVYVPWFDVKKYMHLDVLKIESSNPNDLTFEKMPSISSDINISNDEVEAIINQTFYANQGRKTAWIRSKKEFKYHTNVYDHVKTIMKTDESKRELMLIDGYNVIFASETLQELALENMDAAKEKLIDLLRNYKAIRMCDMILVFDAYRVKGKTESTEKYHEIQVVYTGEAQTADTFIEKFAYKNRDKYRVVVVTSDGMQQMIIRGAGSTLISARELFDLIEIENENINKIIEDNKENEVTRLADVLKVDDEK